MKFRNFLLKRLLANTDYIVGYDADGNYIRISKADLASSIALQASSAIINVQYSSNGNSWHDSYTSGDIYVRMKAGSGSWTSGIRLCVSAYDIWKSQGHAGDEDDFLEYMNSKTVYTSHCGFVETDVIYLDEVSAMNHITLDDYSYNVYNYVGESQSLTINVSALTEHIGRKQHLSLYNSTENDVDVVICNGDGNMLLAEDKLTLGAGSAVILDIITIGVVADGKDNQCCGDNLNEEYVTTISSHSVGKIDKE